MKNQKRNWTEKWKKKMNSKTQKSELWRVFGRVILAIQACENEWNVVYIYRRSEWNQEEG